MRFHFRKTAALAAGAGALALSFWWVTGRSQDRSLHPKPPARSPASADSPFSPVEGDTTKRAVPPVPPSFAGSLAGARFPEIRDRLYQLREGTLLDADERKGLDEAWKDGPEGVLRWLRQRPPGESIECLFLAFASDWGAKHGRAAWDWARASGSDALSLAVLSGMAAAGREEAGWLGAALPGDGERREERSVWVFEVLDEAGYPAAQLRFAESLDEPHRSDFLPRALASLATVAPADAIAQADKLPEGPQRDAILATIVNRWPPHQASALEKLLPALQDGNLRHQASFRLGTLRGLPPDRRRDSGH